MISGHNKEWGIFQKIVYEDLFEHEIKTHVAHLMLFKKNLNDTIHYLLCKRGVYRILIPKLDWVQ